MALPLAAALLVAAAPAAALPNEDLRAWLQAHPVVRFAPEADYGPFVFATGKGEVEGLSIDVLRVLQRRTGLAVTMLPAQPLSRNLQAAREGQVDLMSSLRPTPERARYLDFSLPYVSVPAIAVVRESTRLEPGDPLEALAGRRVAVGEGYAVEEVVRQRYPKVSWQAVADDVQALRGVAEGRFDAAVADSASVAFAVRRHGLRGLRDAGRIGFDYALSFAVRKDWPELRAIIDIGIRSISAEERRQLLQRWAPELAAAERSPRSRPVAPLALLLLALAAAALAWGWWRRRPAPPEPPP